MAKQNYKITIQLQSTGSDNEETRVGHANDAAFWHSVTAQDGTKLDGKQDGHRKPKASNGNPSKVKDIIYWHVRGELVDVLAMCLRWSGAADINITTGNAVSAFTPTIQVMNLPEQE
jgi:hypothetical protein